MNIGATTKTPEMLKFVPDHLKTKKMCKKMGISTFFQKILYMKTGYSSNIFLNFVDFSYVIFLAQNVQIPVDQNLSNPFDKNALIFPLSNI